MNDYGERNNIGHHDKWDLSGKLTHKLINNFSLFFKVWIEEKFWGKQILGVFEENMMEDEGNNWSDFGLKLIELEYETILV